MIGSSFVRVTNLETNQITPFLQYT